MVNRALLSLHGWSLDIKPTVPLIFLTVVKQLEYQRRMNILLILPREANYFFTPSINNRFIPGNFSK